MCLIIQGKPKHFTKEIIKKAFEKNSDGFGLMYLDKSNRVVAKKFYTKKINKILKVFKEHSKNVMRSLYILELVQTEILTIKIATRSKS